jgi:hypothetical protein
MIENGDWLTDDPLGLGGLLVDAWRLSNCAAREHRRTSRSSRPC